MIEIHAAVEDLLGDVVSRSSVKNYLAKGCRRRLQVVERVGHGRYRLIERHPPSSRPDDACVVRRARDSFAAMEHAVVIQD